MADPRAAVSMELGPHDDDVVTVPHDSTIVYDVDEVGGSAQVGLAVSIESDNLVTLAGDGENIFGKLLDVQSDGFCSVQFKGWMTLPGGTSATLTAGARIVGDLLASAEGYIQAAASGTAAHHVVSRGFIYDAATTTAVRVCL